MNKKELRSPFLQSRTTRPLELWQQQSQKICEHLAQWEVLQTAKVILSFISFRQEPDLSYLYQLLPDKTWGFPRCVQQDLAWHQINPAPNLTDLTNLKLGGLEPGKYGIWEPIATLPKIELEQVDVILIPAIACDYEGYRLGYGGGFYDRFLINQSGFKVAVIFADSFVEKLPRDRWDIPMQAVCTDAGLTSSLPKLIVF